MREPLLLLHGFTQTGASWSGVAQALGGERYTPIAPDLPGHGALAARRPVTLDACLTYLRALVREPAAVCGYSMGGRLALHVALALPRLTTRLALVSASPGIADQRERAQRRAADERLARDIEERGVEAFAQAWGAQPLFDGLPERAAAAAHAQRLRQTPHGLAAALRGLGTAALPSLWARLGDLRLPVTVIAGERDEKFRAIAERMAAAIPDARLVVLPGAGHAVHLEQPAALAAALG